MGSRNVAAISNEFITMPTRMLQQREKEINTCLHPHCRNATHQQRRGGGSTGTADTQTGGSASPSGLADDVNTGCHVMRRPMGDRVVLATRTRHLDSD
ncbi:hypothetical protein EYF80_017484 [Liparis tanakae]|uniref:Uncharacterized protein n=1 Tax=Liparis tanakae TaxID=230148 RepID=A0A4Z2I502_9TELE|nr:hypothetical protein EYF80_017484 [Liparis tanakae]